MSPQYRALNEALRRMLARENEALRVFRTNPTDANEAAFRWAHRCRTLVSMRRLATPMR